MPFDETLAERIRQRLARRKNVEEKKMFGGIDFLYNGNMLGRLGTPLRGQHPSVPPGVQRRADVAPERASRGVLTRLDRLRLDVGYRRVSPAACGEKLQAPAAW